MNKETLTEPQETLSYKDKAIELSFATDWICREDNWSRYNDLQVEKATFYSAAIFELIEMSCEPYIEVGIGELNSSRAHKHLLAIRELAELGKHLAHQR